MNSALVSAQLEKKKKKKWCDRSDWCQNMEKETHCERGEYQIPYWQANLLARDTSPSCQQYQLLVLPTAQKKEKEKKRDWNIVILKSGFTNTQQHLSPVLINWSSLNCTLIKPWQVFGRIMDFSEVIIGNARVMVCVSKSNSLQVSNSTFFYSLG